MQRFWFQVTNGGVELTKYRLRRQQRIQELIIPQDSIAPKRKFCCYSSKTEWDRLCVGLTLPPRFILSASKAFCISMVIALSTLPEDSFLCAFCKWSLSELLLKPAFFPQIGQTFIIGFRWCHSIETFPCSFRSRSNRILANPSFGWARRWTRLRAFHASNRVKFLPMIAKIFDLIEKKVPPTWHGSGET